VRPPEDEHSSGEDQILAQVIPLRRRAVERQEDLELSPITPLGRTPIGVFDPPEGPEPEEGYSVWEQPIAELIRRGEPGLNRAPSVHSTRKLARRWILVGAGLAVASCLVVLVFSGWLAGPRSPTRGLSGARASIGARHATTSSPTPPRAPTSSARRTTRDTRTARRARSSEHTSNAGTARAAEQGTGSTGSESSSGANGESSAAGSIGQAPAAHVAIASVRTAASHEFGFESR
jgi:hypothetical protein